ncbi:MAG: hypothetical protein HGA85_00285 [Nanoarchaeota archaeon]|nr:hypothetical protein [Nanoarchaeota archaeon]
MDKIRIAITTTSMGNGHIMKAMAIKSAYSNMVPMLREESIDLEVCLVDERRSLSPVTNMVKALIESLYKAMSSSKPFKIWWDKKIHDPDPTPVKKIEQFVRTINRISGGKCVTPDRQHLFDSVVSTHPSDRVAIFPVHSVFIRVNPDMFCHSFHMIPQEEMEEWHIMVDDAMKKRVLSGKESYLLPDLVPKDGRKIIAVGAYVHPEAIDQQSEKDLKGSLNGTKASVMFQIGGAGAQQDIFLESMRHIDYKRISPLFAAGNNNVFFRKLVNQGLSLGLITEQEAGYALASSFSKIGYENGIMRFSSGLRILYDKDQYAAVELMDKAKAKCLINVVKPGDVTSVGTVLSLLYHIGSHEIENAEWAIEKGFAEWIIQPEKYLRMREEMTQKELDICFGQAAAAYVNARALDSAWLASKHRSIKKMNVLGAYNIASLSVLLSLWKRQKELTSLKKTYLALKEHGFCSLKDSILKAIIES